MRKKFILILLFLLTVLGLAVAAMVGMEVISPGVVFSPSSGGIESQIFWRFRGPRVCVSFLAGSALAVSGMAFQAMFRNPLATPFTLGVSAGAAFGAATHVRFGLPLTMLGVSGISISAFLGATLSIVMVYGLARAKEGFSTATMLLAGVAINFSFSSLILFIQYVSDFTDSFRIVRWLMGRLEVTGFEAVLDMVPFVVTGSAVILYLTHELNLLTTGEDLAVSRGVNIKRTKRVLFLATSLMVGGVVASCGPIGFVGMMAPHICRLLIGSDHRYLAPATLLFGGLFLTVCDAFARTLIAPAEIPVGVMTALLGGPFFLWLLLRGTSAMRVL